MRGILLEGQQCLLKVVDVGPWENDASHEFLSGGAAAALCAGQRVKHGRGDDGLAERLLGKFLQVLSREPDQVRAGIKVLEACGGFAIAQRRVPGRDDVLAVMCDAHQVGQEAKRATDVLEPTAGGNALKDKR